MTNRPERASEPARRPLWRCRRPLGAALITLGCILLAVSALGTWTRLGSYRSFPPRPWERFDPSLAASTPDLNALYRAAQERAGRIASAEALSAEPDVVRRAYAGRGDASFLDNIVSIYATRRDNSWKNYPADAGITVRGQRPPRVEQLAHRGRIAVPAAMVLAGGFLAGAPRRRKGQCARPTSSRS